MTASDHPAIQSYIDSVCRQVRFRDLHREIKMELVSHFQEALDDCISDGLSADEAVETAIMRMGPADMIGKQMNEAGGAGTERWILAVSLIFAGIGLLALFLLEKDSFLPTAIFIRGSVFALIAVMAAILAYRFDYRKAEPYSSHLYLGTLLMLILTLAFGQPVHGIPYLTIGPVSLDFVDISPMLFGLSLAGILNRRQEKDFIKFFLLFNMPLMLMLIGGSLSAAVIFTVMFLTMFSLSGSGKNIGPVILLTVSTAVLTGAFLIVSPLPVGSGGPVDLQTLLESGLYGRGTGLPQVMSPAMHTNFIFSYLILTFGWAAGGGVAAMAFIFLFRLLHLARLLKNSYARLLVAGYLVSLGIGFLWNICANLGFAPLSGAGLPFVSFGGSGLIINGAALGLVFSIYRRRNIGIGV